MRYLTLNIKRPIGETLRRAAAHLGIPPGVAGDDAVVGWLYRHRGSFPHLENEIATHRRFHLRKQTSPRKQT